MLDKVLLAFLVADALFAGTGGLLIGIVFATKSARTHAPTTADVASNLLLVRTPLDGALFNAGLVLFTFAVSLPALIVPSNRTWLKLHGWLVAACAVVTLAIGLDIWYSTLQTRSNLAVLWSRQTENNRSLIQQKFGCCGYYNSQTALIDATCPSAEVASEKLACVGPFSNYANAFLDLVFTAMFGIVALDAILLLCTAMVLKRRAEMERYRHIDDKNRYDSLQSARL
ncbi:phospholipid scramblase 1 [Pseudocyphellaria aurata]|nr:phospholipid scramblase 1 [Pseudocyphellaria aurata]